MPTAKTSRQTAADNHNEIGAATSSAPRETGKQLQKSLEMVIAAVPGSSTRPTDIARRLDVSRVMVSRLLGSINKPDPVETLTRIPGPETLRSIVRAAQQLGVPAPVSGPALQAIDDFDQLIRDQYGTRAALNAAMSSANENTRDKFEQSSRYQVFKGMSQILGVQSNIWLTSMMLTPSKTQPHGIDISTIHGTSGLRRLRSDMPIHFIYGIPPKYIDSRQSPQRKHIDASAFMAHTPAPLTVTEENGQIINTFAPKVGGKDDLYDMLAEVYIPNGSGRYAAPGRTRRGTSVIPDVPVVSLVSDVIIHGDIFEGIEPDLYVYNTMSRGGADIEDPQRDVDLASTNDRIEDLGRGPDNLAITELPKYTDMVRYLCEKNGYKPDDFRTHRLQVQYPVYGFQYVIAYRVPALDEADQPES